ncbi:hypothetical protein AN958_03604 [Leucoagaricus sp. SymC.cos]|nr:hypothetical protein AN958_03604 [Leucoagaricus sp. SymC.cos]
MMQRTPDQLLLFQEVNHEIYLIDKTKWYTYHLPCCSHSLYMNAGWWELQSVSQAAPLICVFKKDRCLQTVTDCWQQNNNTIKDITPLLDQKVIREDITRAKFRLKINLADAYKQIRIRLEDIHKTVFATISEMYISNVIQQGDCNAPATFQCLMTVIF